MSISLETLQSFGDVAAEDDAVLDYFLTTNAVKRVQSNELFLVLGRKGSGKTALVRLFAEGNGAAISKALTLRGYPWNVHSARVDRGAADIEAYVSSWRYLICLEIALLTFAKTSDQSHPKARAIKKFIEDNLQPWLLCHTDPFGIWVPFSLVVSTSVASVSRNRASRKIPLAGLYTSCGRHAGSFSA